MNLKQLQSMGGIASTETKRITAKWKRDEGDTVNVDVAVKVELSYGSLERITRAFANDDRARNARIVAEAVLLVDDDENELPIRYEDADCMKSSLLMALRDAYDQVHKRTEQEQQEEEADAKN